MKKFKFRYEKILDIRIDKENEIKSEMASINSEIKKKEDEINKTKSYLKNFLDETNKSMESGINVLDLKKANESREYLQNKISKLMNELEELNKIKEEKHKEYIEASKERKVMEKIKQKDIDIHNELINLEESKMVDQIVTYNSSKGELNE